MRILTSSFASASPPLRRHGPVSAQASAIAAQTSAAHALQSDMARGRHSTPRPERPACRAHPSRLGAQARSQAGQRREGQEHLAQVQSALEHRQRTGRRRGRGRRARCAVTRGEAPAAHEPQGHGEAAGQEARFQGDSLGKRKEHPTPYASDFREERTDNALTRFAGKRSAPADETLHKEQSESDDTPDVTDADMSHESLHVPHDPVSFTFAMDAAQTADELPDYESLDERDDEQKLGNILPEDSTFALIFRSPAKGASTRQSRSPAKIGYPTLPDDSEEKEQLDTSAEQVEGEDITVTGPTLESAVTEVVANVVDSVRADSAEAELEHADEKEYADEKEDADKKEDADEKDDADMSEIDLDVFRSSIKPGERESTSIVDDESEQVTESSLQLDIQEEYELEGELASQPPTPQPAVTEAHDIAEGLTLSLTPAKTPSREHTPRKLHSPPPPLRLEPGPDDATMTLAIDDDTAILKSFLSRAAASKAERSAIITRRSSLENRRDSDVVRHALASPRMALEEMDPNSPTKAGGDFAFDLTETLVQQAELEETASPTLIPTESDQAVEKAGRESRRSSRAKKSRLPAPASTTQAPTTNKIAIRRADGSDPVVLKKTDAQELALITRNNTRKNKQGAFMVSLRLLKLQAEAILSPPTELDTEEKPSAPGRRGIRWDETLAYYQEHADTIASQEAEAASLATPDELSLPGPVATKKPKAKASTDKNCTPKVRRVKGLGTANGTPGKGLLATGSFLPDAVQEDKAAAAAQPAPTPAPKGIPKPKATRKLPVPSAPTEKLPTLEIAPVGVEPTKERKSRIAPPKSVKIPKPISAAIPSAPSIPAAEKENKRTGISGATPRKGIPAPRMMAPKIATPAPAASVGVESALPRRRGRKV